MTAQLSSILIKVGIGIGSGIVAGIPTLIAYFKARKKAKLATTEEEKLQAEAEINSEMKKLISSAEDVFKQVDVVLKQNGESAGPLKKDTVLSKLIAFAASKSYAFDEEYWSAKIDEEVAFTRNVNGRK